MPPTLSAARPVASGSLARKSRPTRSGSRRRRGPSAPPRRAPLGRYSDARGRLREVIASEGPAGSVLVVDRDAATRGDRRLVAHLAADEPAHNAALICAQYLEDARRDRGRCRRLTIDDRRVAPLCDDGYSELDGELADAQPEPVDGLGNSYRLELLTSRMSIPELRWRRHPPASGDSRPEPVSVREAVASLESYEPVCALTRRALSRHEHHGEVSCALVRAELKRLQDSPIVLNRRLREVVLARTQRDRLSMSEIALRCGRIKRDGRGNESGETSWLARRIGLLAEAGRSSPNPWIHSDVLALVARSGLGVAPREVEST
jgi:hypothetical protein